MNLELAGIQGSDEFLAEGEGYFSTVLGASKRPEVFTPSLVHNLLCMALEKYSMAILLRAGALPQNHTFVDLLEALKQQIPVAAEIEELLVGLDEDSDLCSLSVRESVLPSEEIRIRLIAVAHRFRQAAREMVLEGNVFPTCLE